MASIAQESDGQECDGVACNEVTTGWSQILRSVWVNVTIGLLFFVTFALLRRVLPVYEVRLKHPAACAPPVPPKPSEPTPLNFLWGWVVKVLRVPEEVLFDTSGIDALYYDRVLRLGMKAFTGIAAICMGLILPVNYAASSAPDEQSVRQQFDRITLSNVGEGNNVLWVHFVVVWLITLWVCFLLYEHYRLYLDECHALMAALTLGPEEQEQGTSHDPNLLTGMYTRKLTTHIAQQERTKHQKKGSAGKEIELEAAADEASRSESGKSVSIHMDSEGYHSSSWVDNAEWAKEHSLFSASHVRGEKVDTGQSVYVKPNFHAALITNAKHSMFYGRFRRAIAWLEPLRRKRGIESTDNCEQSSVNTSSFQEFVEQTMQHLFPDTFAYIVPVYDHSEIEGLLLKRHQTLVKYERAVERSEHLSGDVAIKSGTDAVHLQAQLKSLTEDIERKRSEIREGRSSQRPASFFAVFEDQFSAAVATQTLLRPGSGEGWEVQPTPALSDLNWPSLWVTRTERSLRGFACSILSVGIFIFPVGVFTGALNNLNRALCEDGSPIRWEWYCQERQPAEVLRTILTLWVPSILLALWNGVVIPRLFYFLSLTARTSLSLSAVDEEVFRYFYMYGLLNTWLGGMLAGGVASQLQNMIENPAEILILLGTALTDGAGFFIDYLSVQAFLVQPFKLFFPHAGLLWFLCRCCGRRRGCCGWSQHDRLDSWSPKSFRHGANYGYASLPMLLGLVFSVASPLITVFALAVFTTSWVVFRYQALYLFVRVFDGWARLWPTFFSRTVFSLAAFHVIMGSLLITRRKFGAAFILIVVGPTFLYHFHRHCNRRFCINSQIMPLTTSKEQPRVSIDSGEFYSVPMRYDCDYIWQPETGKCWQGWCQPRYGL